MQLSEFVTPARTWLEKRPTLAKEQIDSPVFSLVRMIEEAYELLSAITGDLGREEIAQELADVLNFMACELYILVKIHGFTEEEIIDIARYKYQIRGDLKYPAEGYQNGVPAKEQLNADVNRYMLAGIYYSIPEKGLNPEYGA